MTKLKDIKFIADDHSQHPKSIINYTTYGMIVNDKRYIVVEYQKRDDGLYAILTDEYKQTYYELKIDHTLKAGRHIQIDDNDYIHVTFDPYDDTELRTRIGSMEKTVHELDVKPIQYLPGDGITIDSMHRISTTVKPYDDTEIKKRLSVVESKPDNDTKYHEGDGIHITENNVINSLVHDYDDSELKNRVQKLEAKEDKDTTYTAGKGINISPSNAISTAFDPYDDTQIKNRVTALELGVHGASDSEFSKLKARVKIIEDKKSVSYTAGDGIEISSDNVIKCTVTFDQKFQDIDTRIDTVRGLIKNYTPGKGIKISETGEISVSDDFTPSTPNTPGVTDVSYNNDNNVLAVANGAQIRRYTINPNIKIKHISTSIPTGDDDDNVYICEEMVSNAPTSAGGYVIRVKLGTNSFYKYQSSDGKVYTAVVPVGQSVLQTDWILYQSGAHSDFTIKGLLYNSTSNQYEFQYTDSGGDKVAPCPDFATSMFLDGDNLNLESNSKVVSTVKLPSTNSNISYEIVNVDLPYLMKAKATIIGNIVILKIVNNNYRIYSSPNTTAEETLPESIRPKYITNFMLTFSGTNSVGGLLLNPNGSIIITNTSNISGVCDSVTIYERNTQ